MSEKTRTNRSLTRIRNLMAGAAATISLFAGVACTSSSATNASGDSAGQTTRSELSTTSDAKKTVAERRADDFRTLGYRLEWIGYPVYSKGSNIKFIDIYDDIVIAHGADNTTTVLETNTGANRWHRKMGGKLNIFLGNVKLGNQLLICSESEIFIADVRTGELMDRQSLAVLANTPPVIFGEMAIFGCTTGELLGHNLRSGYKQWGYLLRGAIRANPVELDGAVGVVSQDGEVLVVNPANGSSIGRNTIYEGLANNPVANERMIFIASEDQSVWAFNRFGQLIWRERTELPLRTQPVLHEDTLYLDVPREGFVAFNASDGSRRWTTEGVSGRAIGIRDNRLLVWDGSHMTMLDPQRGDVIERVKIDNVRIAKMQDFVDGILYLVMQNGELQKYSPRRR